MIVRDNCCLVCTELRRSGYDEEGILSVIPHKVLIRTIHNLGLNEEEVVEYLLTYEYLEKTENGYQFTGEDFTTYPRNRMRLDILSAIQKY